MGEVGGGKHTTIWNPVVTNVIFFHGEGDQPVTGSGPLTQNTRLETDLESGLNGEWSVETRPVWVCRKV